MRSRRSRIPQRRPVFIGCEGESETGYVGLLQDLLHAAGIPVHLITQNLGLGAGDPLSRIEMAVRKIEHLRRTRTAPTDRFVFLDHDQVQADPARAHSAQRLADSHAISIVWQRPCFEALILRHLPLCATRRPPDTPEAQRALKREWPGYEKPMTRVALARRIDLAAVLRAAAVEIELRTLLDRIGLRS